MTHHNFLYQVHICRKFSKEEAAWWLNVPVGAQLQTLTTFASISELGIASFRSYKIM